MIIVLGNSNVASKLRLYSQVCRSFLGKLDLLLHKYFAHSFMCKFKLWSLSDVHLTVWCQVNKKYYFSAPLLAQQNLDQSVFEPMSNNRPGYKPAEIKPEVNQSEHNAFTMPAPQPHTAEDKGRNRLKWFFWIHLFYIAHLLTKILKSLCTLNILNDFLKF